MGTLIDSSIVIAVERGLLALERVLSRHSEQDPLALSALTASELLHGVHRAESAARRRRREAFVEGMLNTLSVVAFDLIAARVHARIAAQMDAKGTRVGERDLMIAASAIALDYRVATRDRSSFPRIPGLEVEFW